MRHVSRIAASFVLTLSALACSKGTVGVSGPSGSGPTGPSGGGNNSAPTLSAEPTAPYDVTEGETLTITVSAADADGDGLTFDLGACATETWITCTDNGDGTATISITPPTDAGGGNFSLDISVSDGGSNGTTVLTLEIDVTDSGLPTLSFTGLNDGGGHVANRGASNTAVLAVPTDGADGDPITCALGSGTPSYVSYDDTSRVFTIAPGNADTDGTVSLDCEDAAGGTTSASFVVSINDAPTAIFSFAAASPVPAGAPTAATDASTDPDADTLSCLWATDAGVLNGDITSCAGVSLSLGCSEAATVTLTVTDPWGLSDTESHDLTAEANGPYVHKRADCTGACGSRQSPWCTIQAALAVVTAGNIYVAKPEGVLVYNDGADGGSIEMVSGVSLLGGYDAADWDTAPGTTDFSRVDLAVDVGILFDGVSDVAFAGFDARLDGGGAQVSERTVLTLDNTDETVVVRNNRLDATTGNGDDYTTGIAIRGANQTRIEANLVDGGDGATWSAAINVVNGAIFNGEIVDHLAANGHGVECGDGPYCYGIWFDGENGPDMLIADNDVTLSSSGTDLWGIGAAIADGFMVSGGTVQCLAAVDRCVNVYIESNPGAATSVIDGVTILGGLGDEWNGVWVMNADVALNNIVIQGGEGTVSYGVFTSGDSILSITGGTIIGGSAGISTALHVGGQTVATVSGGASLIGYDSSGDAMGAGVDGNGDSVTITGSEVVGCQDCDVGWGVRLSNTDLEITDSTISGGGATQGIGVLWITSATASTLRLGGDTADLGNTISGAYVDGTGAIVAGGNRRLGTYLEAPNALTLSTQALVRHNTILGGAPNNDDPGPTNAMGLGVLNVRNIQVRDNVIRGCEPSCTGAVNGADPLAVGVWAAGAARVSSDDAGGGLYDNLIEGGPATASSAASIGLFLTGTASALPEVTATGNTILGNDDTTGDPPATAAGVGVRAGYAGLIDNPRIEGGVAGTVAIGVLVAPDDDNLIDISDNDLITGNLSFPANPAGVAAGIYNTGVGTSASLIVDNNTRIVGGYSAASAYGTVLDAVDAGTTISRNNIAGGIAGAAGVAIGLLHGSSVASGILIEQNLIEACGIYDTSADPPVHHPDCGNTSFSRGVRTQSSTSFNLWNNRIFGGHALPIAGPGTAVALEIFAPPPGGLTPKQLFAHNYLHAQGGSGAGTIAQALAIRTPDAVVTGGGLYVINNILDNGGTSATRYHVFEDCADDLTELVVMHNAFSLDTALAAAPVVYRECKASPVDEVPYGPGNIAAGCASGTCLDDDATGDPVFTHSNYDGNLEAAVTLVGSALAIRESPRELPLTDFRLGGTDIQDKGYTLIGADPYGLDDLRQDFEQETPRSSPPDIGHDEILP